MVEQDGRGSLSEKSKPILYLPSGQRAYDRAMSGVEKSSGTTGENGALKGVRAGTRESRAQAGGPAKRKPSLAALGDNRGHSCSVGEYCGIHRRFFQGLTTYKENERLIRAHCLQ